MLVTYNDGTTDTLDMSKVEISSESVYVTVTVCLPWTVGFKSYPVNITSVVISVLSSNSSSDAFNAIIFIPSVSNQMKLIVNLQQTFNQ